MATVNITGSIADVVGAAAAGARLTIQSVLPGWSNGDALVLGNPFVVTADGSGDVNFDVEPGDYRVQFQLSTGEKVVGMSVGSDGPYDLAEVINATTAQALTTILQTVLGYKTDAETARDEAQEWAEGTEPGGPGTKSAKEHAADSGDSADLSAASATAASLAEQQSQAAAVVAGAPIAAAFPTNDPETVALPSPFLFIAPEGVQSWTHSGTFASLAQGPYASRVEFEDLAAVLAYAGPPLPVGLTVRTRREGISCLSVSGGEHVTTPGGTKVFVLPGAFVFPSTGPGGDDAPNIVLGAYGGVDLPDTTYGNFVWVPRDPNVSGGVGYRNRLGANTSLSAILGGDNDFDALAVFNMGHHNSADAADGASHPFMLGTYLRNGGAYGVNMGTENDNWSTKSAILSGQGHRIGTQGVPDNARNSVVTHGYQNTIDGKYALAGGYLCKAQKDYSMATGQGAISNDVGERTHAANFNLVSGDTYYRTLHLNRVITGGSATELLCGGVARTAIGSKTVINGTGLVTAVRTDVEGESATWKVEYEVSNMNGTLTVKAFTATAINADVATGGGRTAWVCDMVIASGIRPALRIKGESSPSTTLNCSAVLEELVTRKL